MSTKCELCGKQSKVGYTYTRRGLAKAKGGVGQKITGKSKRRFYPNIQRVKAKINGTVRRIRVCTKCIRSGKVIKVA